MFYFLWFQIPLNLPCSVTLQPGPEDTGKVGGAFYQTLTVTSVCPPSPAYNNAACAPQACGVDFEVKAFCAENAEEKIHKR